MLSIGGRSARDRATSLTCANVRSGSCVCPLSRAVFQTTAEASFQKPGKLPTDEFGRPLRRLYVGRIKKRADLSFSGESDNILPQDEPRGVYSVAIDDIYPEKFEGAAGMSSKTQTEKLAQAKMVEYFPEHVVQSYVSGEADELIYGAPIDPNPAVREVPMLNPGAYMDCAGLTSKEMAHRVRRDHLEENLEDPTPHHAKDYVATDADRVMYGRYVGGDPVAAKTEITQLPTCGSPDATNYGNRAGLKSKAVYRTTSEPLDLRLDKKVSQKASPYLSGVGDEVLYGRHVPANRTDVNEIKDLKPPMFAGAAGITSLQDYKINQEDLIMPECHPEEHKLGQARWGGEGEETIYGAQGERGLSQNRSVEYEVQKLAPDRFDGAAGMTSSMTATVGTAETHVFGLNATSAQATGSEAKAAMYHNAQPQYEVKNKAVRKIEPGDRSFDPVFDLSSLYPKQYKNVAGSSSRELFCRTPESDSCHLFSENLKKKEVGQPGRGTDARPKIMPGSAGMTSKEAFRGHPLQAIGDEPGGKWNNDKDGDGVADHLRDEEADLVIYGGPHGGDLPEAEFAKVATAQQRKPAAYAGAAGLTSKQIFHVTEEHLLTPEHHPEEHKLGMANWAGEFTNGREREHEVHKIAPEKYDGAAGLKSKEEADRTIRGDASAETGGKKMLGTAGRKDLYATTDQPKRMPKEFKGAAGLTSKELYHLDSEESRYQKGLKKDLLEGGEAAAVVFNKVARGGASPKHASGDDRLFDGAAGAASEEMPRAPPEARTFSTASLRDPGGMELKDVIYGRVGADEDAQVYEIPELYPAKFAGAAGLDSKSTSRLKGNAYMFGERCEGVEYGAKHRTAIDPTHMPSAAELNQHFNQASHWFEPDVDLRLNPPEPPPGWLDDNALDYDGVGVGMARHNQSTADEVIFGADIDGYRGHEYFGYPPGVQPTSPEAASPPRPSPSPQQRTKHRRDQLSSADEAIFGRDLDGSGEVGIGGPPPPPDHYGSAAEPPRQQSPSKAPSPARSSSSPSKLERPAWDDGSGRHTSAPAARKGPQLFEKGSFAHRKLESMRHADSAGGPVSGRSTERSSGAMGAYASFASRMEGINSRRSQRSERSFR